MERRAAAILAVDVVGEGDAGALAGLEAVRAQVIDPTVAEHQGRPVKLKSDGMQAEFASAVEAVTCAVEMQRAMAARKQDLPSDDGLTLKIDIDLGDIIVKGGDRRGGRPLAVESLSEAQVKKMTKPLVAVPPLVNKTGDPELTDLASGITEAIITELGRFRAFTVVASSATIVNKERAVGLRQASRELGVDYLVEGAVRRSGRQLRITVQLLEAAVGGHLWAGRYDRELDDLSAHLGDLAGKIAATLAGRLADADRGRALRKPADRLGANDLLLCGKHIMERASKNQLLEARALFERAVAADPSHAPAYVELAMSYAHEAGADWAEDPDRAADKAFDLARWAVELDQLDSRGHLVLAWAYFRVKGDFEQAAGQLEWAIALNPNDCDNYSFKSWLLTCAGDSTGAVSSAKEALRRDPFAPDGCLWSLGFSDYLAGRYEEAIRTFGKMVQPHVEIPALIAACYAALGRREAAENAAAAFRQRIQAEITPAPTSDATTWRAFWRQIMPFKEEATLDSLLAGLAKAGLPD